jgi:hypothetical protein
MITFKQFLTEAQRNKIILIDFQPSYEKQQGYDNALSAACSYINNNPNIEVIAFYNGAESGVEDDEYQVKEHYLEYGLLEDKLDNIEFVEKTYAFLRSWMDQGVDDSIIIQTLRHMLIHHLNSSDEIELEQLQHIIGDNWDAEELNRDPIYFTDLPIVQLKTFSNALMGGGAHDLCFREIQLLLSVFNIKNKEVQEWIYN